MLLNRGIPERLLSLLSEMSPPITRVWPDWTIAVVSAVLFMNFGNSCPATSSEPPELLNSCFILSVTLSFALMWGVTWRMIPAVLYCIWPEETSVVAPPPVAGCWVRPVAMGMSSPISMLASLLSTARICGLASTWRLPFEADMLKRALNFVGSRMFTKAPFEKTGVKVKFTTFPELSEVARFPGADEYPPIPVILSPEPLTSHSSPNFVLSSRVTSAIITSIRTCFGGMSSFLRVSSMVR